jgi:aminoglycoside 3-N-acetyltransferase
MLTYQDFVAVFKLLDLGPHSRVVIHASLPAFGSVAGQADTVVRALVSTCETILVPTFTYRTMVTPLVGPPDNAITYGSADERNGMAEIFHLDMPADPAMGVIAETLRRHPDARRSGHPVLSFAGVKADEALEAQTLEDPLAPIGWMAEYDADVLLLGVDHTVNTCLHYAEKLAGRVQFIRWALTPQAIVACPGWPGCSDGFQAIAPRLEGVTRKEKLGAGVVEAIALRDLINIAVGWIHQDPRALLCDRMGCERCAATRASVRVES